MTNATVKRNTILAYGGLATPLAMIGYPIAIWLIPFYSEVVGIPLYIIANLLLIARFTDVITDPILGQLGDSTRTKIGRRKPWIILGVPLMMLAIYKLFIPGTEVSITYFVVWMMLMYLGSTIINIPYGAWGAEISPDYHQRSRVVGGREGWTLIGLLISALIPLAIEVSGQGISFTDEYHGFTFYGAIDDVWIKKNGDLIVSDVKSTSKKEFNWAKTWDEYDYPKAYKRQLEMYQWLFKKNGFSVSNKAYLVYYNGLKDEPMFDKTLKFESFLVEFDCNDNWVEEAIIHAKKLMDTGSMPKGSYKCDTCQYLKKRWNISNNQKSDLFYKN